MKGRTFLIMGVRWSFFLCKIRILCRAKDSLLIMQLTGREAGFMKRELGIARCGLACCLCSENIICAGCDSGQCPDKDGCENRKCSISKGIKHCYECSEACQKGMLSKIKPYAFTEFAKRYGEDTLLDCLERNEKMGVIYHREGINGDYDDFDDVEELINFIKTGNR